MKARQKTEAVFPRVPLGYISDRGGRSSSSVGGPRKARISFSLFLAVPQARSEEWGPADWLPHRLQLEKVLGYWVWRFRTAEHP